MQKSKHTSQSPGSSLAAALGGGPLANIPLSMHSEMMAIRSALSLSAHDSASSARSTAWCKKSCFKLSGVNKRKSQLQIIREYVKAVCSEAESTDGRTDTQNEYSGPTQGDEWRFEAATSGLVQAEPQCSQRAQEGRGEEGGREEGAEKAWEKMSSRPRSVRISLSRSVS